MTETAKTVVTVGEILSVDVIKGKGIGLNFLGIDGREHLLQVPIDEAYGLADMVELALTNLANSR